MTQDHSDKILELAQELFQQDEGVKQLLAALIEQAMQAEVNQHLGAQPYQRIESRRGTAQRQEAADVQDAQRRTAFRRTASARLRALPPVAVRPLATQRTSVAGGLQRDVFPRRLDAARRDGSGEDVRSRHLSDDGFARRGGT